MDPNGHWVRVVRKPLIKVVDACVRYVRGTLRRNCAIYCTAPDNINQSGSLWLYNSTPFMCKNHRGHFFDYDFLNSPTVNVLTVLFLKTQGKGKT